MDDTPAAPSAGRPRVALVAAVASNGVIGSDNRLPWRLPEDLARFKALTLGHRVVMGRRTFESIGRALPGRENVVVSRRPGFAAPGCRVVGSLAAALGRLALPEPVFVIGGADLYAQALALADRLYLTEIHAEFPGDARFPAIDRARWRETAREPGRSAGGIAFDFVTYERAD